MQAEIGVDRMRTGAARPTRWIPAEVWQRQGMTAQVLTLPGGNFSLKISFAIILLFDCSSIKRKFLKHS